MNEKKSKLILIISNVYTFDVALFRPQGTFSSAAFYDMLLIMAFCTHQPLTSIT